MCSLGQYTACIQYTCMHTVSLPYGDERAGGLEVRGKNPERVHGLRCEGDCSEGFVGSRTGRPRKVGTLHGGQWDPLDMCTLVSTGC
jgi:hypothetical protein